MLCVATHYKTQAPLRSMRAPASSRLRIMRPCPDRYDCREEPALCLIQKTPRVHNTDVVVGLEACPKYQGACAADSRPPSPMMPMATYSMPGSVMISERGMKPLATSTQLGLTAASSYTKHAKMVAHSSSTSACVGRCPRLVSKKAGRPCWAGQQSGVQTHWQAPLTREALHSTACGACGACVPPSHGMLGNYCADDSTAFLGQQPPDMPCFPRIESLLCSPSGLAG